MDFDWKQFLFSFEGRVCRKDYWFRMALPLTAFSILLWFLMGVDESFGLLGFLFVWSGTAVGVKRCHDCGLAGWWVLARCVPLLGGPLFDLTIGLIKGEPGYNRFGNDPLSGRF
jgi:uncharacterized membrane protein YhaH (DUF805 family)